ncbi:MAG TPA: DUF1648 domain-containing protein [Crocinitomicaceae bacterium]|nr:DUF1648 domain-containing protein [Crocinitomicaceae bacterium]
MNNRPKIKLKQTKTDILAEVFGWVSLVAFWAFVLVNYANLPDTIPTHFDYAGKADGFDDKESVFELLLVATVIFIGMTILGKFPHIFNYPTEITEENALKQYTNATRLLRYIKLIIVVVFGVITLQSVRVANGQINDIGSWLLPATLGLIFIPVFYFLIKSFQLK